MIYRNNLKYLSLKMLKWIKKTNIWLCSKNEIKLSHNKINK